MKRRRFLGGATAAMAGLSGCLLPGAPEDCDPEHPVKGFRLRNHDRQTRSVEVSVIFDLIVYTDVVFQRTYEIEGVLSDNNTAATANVPNLAGNHIVRVRVGNETTEYMWPVTPGSECDSLRIVIDGGRATIDPIIQGSSAGGGS